MITVVSNVFGIICSLEFCVLNYVCFFSVATGNTHAKHPWATILTSTEHKMNTIQIISYGNVQHLSSSLRMTSTVKWVKFIKWFTRISLDKIFWCRNQNWEKNLFFWNEIKVRCYKIKKIKGFSLRNYANWLKKKYWMHLANCHFKLFKWYYKQYSSVFHCSRSRWEVQDLNYAQWTSSPSVINILAGSEQKTAPWPITTVCV